MHSLDEINHSNLQNFDLLPNAAYVRMIVVQSLFSCSRATLWRWVKSGRLPAPKKIGVKNSAWNVAELREALKNVELRI